MRPYLAVIRDSLREALASRVLWVLLSLITLLLVALAPLQLATESTTNFQLDDIRDVRRFVEQLRASDDANAAKPPHFVWNHLPDSLRDRVRKFDRSSRRPRFDDMHLARQLAEDLSRLTEDDSFYDQQVWAEVDWSEEGRQLQQTPFTSLDAEQQRRSRRLMIEAAFPRQFRQAPRESVAFTYAGWEVGIPAMPRRSAETLVKTVKLGFMEFVIGIVGILAGILVTASIIPQTFSSGTIYLLLSKPISRPLLFLSQFVGGCSFVLVMATYLIAGVWLILGVRLGMWDHRLLYAIPIFLFLFSIYYSVSSVAGLIWHSTLMAIVATVVFWLVCTIVGSSKELIDLFAIRSQRLVEIVPAGKELFAYRQTGQIARWNESLNVWSPAFVVSQRRDDVPAIFMNQRDIEDLVFDVRQNRLLGRKDQFGQQRIYVGRSADDWAPVDVAAAPAQSLRLVPEPGGGVLAIAADGIYRFAEELQPAEEGINIFGFKIPAPAPKSYERISENPPRGIRLEGADPSNATNSDDRVGNSDTTDTTAAIALSSTSSEQQAGLNLQEQAAGLPRRRGSELWSSDARFTYDLEQQAVVVWDENVVSTWCKRVEGDASVATYFLRNSESAKRDTPVLLIASAQGILATADESGRVVLSDTESTSQTFVPYSETRPLALAASKDGRWWVATFANDRIWLYDRQQNQDVSAKISHPGDLSAVVLEEGVTTRLLLANARGQIWDVNLSDFTKSLRCQPALTLLERVYYYAIKPIYTIFPKPKQLTNTMNYLITGKDTVELDRNRPGGNTVYVKLDPWGPVWSSALFTCVVLLLGCIHMQRQEF